MLKRIKELFAARPREQVAFDEQRVVRTMPNGNTESVSWEALAEVAIVTTDEGPFAEDVFWLLIGDDGGCVVPQGADGSDALLRRLQELPNFDNEAVIRAMGCATNARFRAWQRPQS